MCIVCIKCKLLLNTCYIELLWIQKIVGTGLLCGEETGDGEIRRVGNVTFL